MKLGSKKIIFLWLLAFGEMSYGPKDKAKERPLDVWAFRSVLDKKPRMLTLALNQECYVAYDLAHCKLYKAWKGGVSMDGAAYTDKKEIQPTSWGATYFLDSLPLSQWHVQIEGQESLSRTTNSGYFFRNNQIYLKYALILASNDTIKVEERPEFVRNAQGKPGLERIFKTTNLPTGAIISLKSGGTVIQLNTNSTTNVTTYFEPLPEQFLPKSETKFTHAGRAYMEKSDCFVCHKIEENEVGPSFKNIAQRYPNNKKSVAYLSQKIKDGGTGTWGAGVMNSHALLTDQELENIIGYIFTLKPKENKTTVASTTKKDAARTTKPGFGTALEGVHPSYDLNTLHSQNFKPRVGAMAFLPDGRLLITTWDKVGGVYILDHLETGDSTKISVKRIASGLAEPLGIEVVNNEIYVLQKQELTKLIDSDGDEIIDQYQVVCNSWGVTSDFHEFAFGLVHKDGYFYISLSMAMRLKPDEKQLSDRGRVIKIAKDGSFKSVNFGLRTPNGIGLGIENEIFVTDNQGQWLPSNKLIHVKKGEYHGMAWGWLNDQTSPPPMAQPAIWLPEHEIGNSPSEPVLIKQGLYKGQMLHGDVTHGGIKRDFLEKINGQYQGAVFRFSQGFEAGVNRLRWGPDGALYVGEVGMTGGGWSWKERLSGLQRLKYNGKPTFEMLAVRAKPQGFEIEFTEPLKTQKQLHALDFLIQQWWYKPTKNYGGPKMDLEELKIIKMQLSKDRKVLYLEIPNLKKEHVVYFRLPDHLKSEAGRFLWSSEAWYTLNSIP